MVSGVAISVAAHISDRRQVFGILLPGFPGAEQMSNDVVGRDFAGKVVVVGDDLTGGEHEVVADGRVRVRVVALGVGVSGRQAVQIGHVASVADDLRKAVIFLQRDENVPNLRAGGGERSSNRSSTSRWAFLGSVTTHLNRIQSY